MLWLHNTIVKQIALENEDIKIYATNITKSSETKVHRERGSFY